MIPLVIDPTVQQQIKDLTALALANPIDMTGLAKCMLQPDCKARHKALMTRQTIHIPAAYFVTFSIEHGHPVGPCRHMSMSVDMPGRVPNQTSLWLIAHYFGFRHGLQACTVWKETLTGHGIAINLVQTLNES